MYSLTGRSHLQECRHTHTSSQTWVEVWALCSSLHTNKQLYLKSFLASACNWTVSVFPPSEDCSLKNALLIARLVQADTSGVKYSSLTVALVWRCRYKKGRRRSKTAFTPTLLPMFPIRSRNRNNNDGIIRESNSWSLIIHLPADVSLRTDQLCHTKWFTIKHRSF